MSAVTVTLDREIAKTTALAIRHKLKRREADARRRPWHPRYGPRDLTSDEIKRLRLALDAFDAAIHSPARHDGRAIAPMDADGFREE